MCMYYVHVCMYVSTHWLLYIGCILATCILFLILLKETLYNREQSLMYWLNIKWIHFIFPGLINLVELIIDNTLVTNAGMVCLASLKRLEVLSLSDTKWDHVTFPIYHVTSSHRVGDGFIVDGCLDPLGTLSKLNLTRTAVTDNGILR